MTQLTMPQGKLFSTLRQIHCYCTCLYKKKISCFNCTAIYFYCLHLSVAAVYFNLHTNHSITEINSTLQQVAVPPSYSKYLAHAT